MDNFLTLPNFTNREIKQVRQEATKLVFRLKNNLFFSEKKGEKLMKIANTGVMLQYIYNIQKLEVYDDSRQDTQYNT